MLHHVKDLSREERRKVERLLGRPVAEDEAVSIKSVKPSAIVDAGLSPEQRQVALERLDAYFAKVDARRQPVSVDEEEAVITEALLSARRDREPVH